MNDADTSANTPAKAIAIQTVENDQPQITAKGTGILAEKILDIAFAEGVKVRQDEALTSILDAYEVDSPIPLEALHSVALILERVYQENERLRAEDSA